MNDDGIVITEGNPALQSPQTETIESPQIESLQSDMSNELQSSESVDSDEHVEETSNDIGSGGQSHLVSDTDPVSVKKRINKMYQDKRQAEIRAQQAQQQAAMLQQELMRINQGSHQQPQQNVDPNFPREPDENHPYYAENPKAYLKDYAAYQRNIVVYEMRQQQTNQYHSTVESRYNEQLENARGKYEDFDEKIDSLGSLPIGNSPQANEVILSIKELDNSAEVAYYYANNHAEFARLFNMPSRMAAIQLGKTSEKLNASPVSRKSTPPPPKSLKGTGLSHQKKDINDLSVDDIYKAIRSKW